MKMVVWSEVTLTDKFMSVLRAVMKDCKVKAEIEQYDGHTGLVLCLGKPDESVKGKLIYGPSGAMVMGTAPGLEKLRRAVRLWKMHTQGKVENPMIMYQLIEPGILGLGNIVQTTLGHEWLCVDIEVSGNISVDEPEDTELLSVAIDRYRDGKHDIWVWTKEALQDAECRAALAAILTCGVPLLAHNGQFDFKWINNHLKSDLYNSSLRERWGAMYAKKVDRIYPNDDTMLKHYIMYPAAGVSSHGLKDLAQNLLGAPEWEGNLKKWTVGKAHYENIPPYFLYAYNAADVFWTSRLNVLLNDWLESGPEPLRQAYARLISWVPMFVDVEDTEAGWPIDTELGRATEAKLLTEAETLRALVRKVVGDPLPVLPKAAVVKQLRRDLWESDKPEKVRKEYRRYLPQDQIDSVRTPTRAPVIREEELKFNPGSPSQVKGWLTLKGADIESTDEKALKELRFADPGKKVVKFIDALMDYRHTTKMQSTYVTGVLNVERNGRVRAKYKLTGTVTGRLASTKPAIQTIPNPDKDGKGWEYKGMWVCDPGESIVGVDYSQMETRCVAEMCGDPQMIDDLQEGREDFFALLLPGAFPQHFRSMKQVLKMKEEDNAMYNFLRGRIKPFSHGVNYGRRARAIAMDLKMPLYDAEKIMASYLGRYPDLVQWQQETMSFVEGRKIDPDWGVPGLWTKFGRRFQQGVITESNEVPIENAALAFRPQSTGSDICLTAAHELHTQHLPQLGARLVGFIHDALYVIAPEDNAHEVKEVMETVMRNAATKLFTRVPFMAKGKIGKRWSDV